MVMGQSGGHGGLRLPGQRGSMHGAGIAWQGAGCALGNGQKSAAAEPFPGQNRVPCWAGLRISMPGENQC